MAVNHYNGKYTGEQIDAGIAAANAAAPQETTYTKEEIDKNCVKNTDISAVMDLYGITSKTLIHEMRDAIAENIKNGKKNLVEYNVGISGTASGIKWSVNDDGSVTVSGSNESQTSSAFIKISSIPNIGDGIQLIMTGAPEGANKNTFGLYVSDKSSGIAYSYENESVTFSQRDGLQVGMFIWVHSGYSFPEPVTFFPLVCRKELYNIDQSFQPYAMSNVELTKRIADIEKVMSNYGLQMLPIPDIRGNAVVEKTN